MGEILAVPNPLVGGQQPVFVVDESPVHRRQEGIHLRTLVAHRIRVRDPGHPVPADIPDPGTFKMGGVPVHVEGKPDAIHVLPVVESMLACQLFEERPGRGGRKGFGLLLLRVFPAASQQDKEHGKGQALCFHGPFFPKIQTFSTAGTLRENPRGRHWGYAQKCVFLAFNK